jgi:hypothetical protein
MSEYLRVVVTFHNGSQEILYCSKRYYNYVLEISSPIWEATGLRPSMFNAQDCNDEIIIECIKLREKDFPIDKARENLPSYDE